jgi:hypothetical protein
MTFVIVNDKNQYFGWIHVGVYEFFCKAAVVP